MIPEIGMTQSLAVLEQKKALPSTEMIDGTKQERMEQVAQDFESLFVNQLLKRFDETVDHEDNIMYGGHAEDMFRGMLNDEIAKTVAKGGGVGIASMVREEIIRSYEMYEEGKNA